MQNLSENYFDNWPEDELKIAHTICEAQIRTFKLLQDLDEKQPPSSSVQTLNSLIRKQTRPEWEEFSKHVETALDKRRIPYEKIAL